MFLYSGDHYPDHTVCTLVYETQTWLVGMGMNDKMQEELSKRIADSIFKKEPMTSACTSGSPMPYQQDMLKMIDETKEKIVINKIPKRIAVIGNQFRDSMSGLRQKIEDCVDACGGFIKVVSSCLPTKTIVQVQNRTHRRKRINKKWAKRYGFHEEERDCFYLIDEKALQRDLRVDKYGCFSFEGRS